jgi:hypothetical protein
MPKLNIPDRHKAAIKKVLELSTDVILQLSNVLAGGGELPQPLRELLGPNPEAVVAAVRSLYQGKAYLDLPGESFAKALVDATRTLGLFMGEDEDKVLARIMPLFSISSLEQEEKAHVLEREHACLFHEAKVLTDIRPIFGLDIDAEPEGTIIGHTLKIVYHTGFREHKELFLALDTKDLRQLAETVERATAKDRSLKNLLSNKGLRVLGS